MGRLDCAKPYGNHQRFTPILNSNHIFKFFLFIKIFLAMIVLLVPIVTLFESFSDQRLIIGRRIMIVFQYLLGFENSAMSCRIEIFDA